MGGPVTSTAVRSGQGVRATRLVFAANGGLFATWVSRIPAIRDDLGADERGLGFALLFIAVGSLLAMPLSGRLIERLGERVVLAACVLLAMLAYCSLALAPSLVVLAVGLFFVGAASGVWDVAMNVAGHAVEQAARRTLMPGFHAAWSLGAVAGAGIGAVAAKADVAPVAHFTIVAVVVGAGTLYAVRALPDSRTAESPDPSGERHVTTPASGASLLRDRRLVLLGLMTLCAAWAEGAANDWLALLLTDERSASGAAAAAGFAAFASAMTLGRVAGNRFIDVVGRVRALRIGAAVAMVGVITLLALPVLAVSYLGAVMWGLGIAVAFPLAMTTAGETPGRGPGAIAMVATIAYSGFLAGPPLIGMAAHAVGLDNALWVVVALTVGIFLLAHNARPAPADGGVRG